MAKKINEIIFRAYDVRGIYPTEIDEETVYLTAKAYAEWLKPEKVVLGRDVRTSGEALFEQAKRGLLEMGVDVVDIGIVSSEMFLFAVAHYGFDGGISITASHDPAEYNGMKIVREGSVPVSIEAGLAEIRDIAIRGEFQNAEKTGEFGKLEIMDDYIGKVLSFVDAGKVKPMKVVFNTSDGTGGRVVSIVAEKLGLDLVKQNFEEDGTFPKGAPNPLLPENQKETQDLIRSSQAKLGVALDGDADRCFFFDENGEFVDSCYANAIIFEIILKKNPGAKIVFDTSVVWVIRDSIEKNGGVPLENKVGYVFLKDRMRKEDALFAGEHSGHYFSKDFYFCDSGIIPALMLIEYLSVTGLRLSEIVNPLKDKYPISGEVRFEVTDPDNVFSAIEARYSDGEINHMDGVTAEFPDWRVNVRPSNTEPLVRMNIEAKTRELVDEKVRELTSLIEG